MRNSRFQSFALALTITAWTAFGQASEPRIICELEPAQATYYVGQRVTLKLTLDFGQAVDNFGIDRLSGLPDQGLVKLGDFQKVASSDSSKAVLVTDMVLLKRGISLFAPETQGQLAIRTSGFSRRITSFQLASLPVELTIVDLPGEGRPEDFSGVVGAFALMAELAPSTARVGDLLNLKWTLVGNGTADGVAAQAAYAPGDGFRVYPPQVTVQADGVVVGTQVIIPLSTNITEAAAFSLSTFNPIRERYEVLSVGPFPLTIQTREASAAPVNTLTGLVVRVQAADSSPKISGTDVDGTGWTRFLRRNRGKEAALIVGSPARLAPDAGARVLFDIPAEAVAEICEQSGDWVRARYEGASGWIPTAVLQRP